ncbi:SDR family oxidoreductase [Bradyrhizobium sp. RDM12]
MIDQMSSADEKRCLVIGATGLVGGHILRLLLQSGQRPLALSRSRKSAANVDWFCGDLAKPDALNFPAFTTLYCTADAILLADALPHIFSPSLKRIVVFSSTSVMTKRDSEVAEERELLGRLAEAEDRIVLACARNAVEWTILRPTLIYDPGRDTNITPLSRLIRRFGFMPWSAAARSPTAGTCGGSGHRSHRGRINRVRCEQVLFSPRRRDADLS